MKNFINRIVLSLLFIVAFSSIAWAQPANNDCSTATSFGSLPTPGACSSGLQDGAVVTLSGQTTVGATGASPYVYLTGCTGGGNMQSPALDTWYSFVATGNLLNLAIAGFPNASIGVWSGTCASPTGVACYNVGGSGNGSVVIPSLVIGNTYYIQISGGTTSATDSNFSISLDNDIDCNDCLRTSTLTATPAPVNGAYSPGQVVRYCFTVSNWVETNSNWFHGVQITMGPGWTGTITNTTPATQCGYNPPGPGDPGAGVWAYYNSVTSSATGQVFGPGFYFDNANVAGSNPGQNFGDVTDGSCSWTFCWDLTVSATCVAGQNLGVTINTSGDGESGSWSSLACTGDPVNATSTVMAPGPTMTSPAAATICSNTAVNIPLTANVASTFTWIATANPNVTGESTTLQSTSTLNNTLVNTSGVVEVVTYTVTPTSTPAGCLGTAQTVLVTVNPQPNAGADGNTTVCDSSVAAINLFGLITGEQAGGVWTQTSGAGGVFNAAAGTYTPAAGATTSTFTYTLTGVAPCIDDTSVATININPQPNAGADGNTLICDSSVAAINLFGLITGEQAGGVWTQTSGAGGVFNAAAGTYTPAAGATTSTFTYTLTGIAPCINDTSVATININPQPNAGADGNTTICDSSVAAINLFGLITGEQAGGVWTQTSGAGGVFNAAAGTYTPAAGATTSTFTYTLTGIAPCINDTSVATININPQPNAGADGNTTICDSSVAAINLFGLITGEQAGGVWTQTSGAGGVFNAAAGTYTPAAGATTSTFTYTLTGIAPCINDTSVATININPQPNAGADGNTTICDSSVAAINLFGLIAGEQAGGVWTQTSGAGGVFNAAAGTYTPAAGATTSTFTYTLTGIAPCINDTSVATININPQPNAGADGNTTICDSSVAAINLFGLITGEQAGGVWTQTSGAGGAFNAAAGTYTPAAGATTSTFTYTLTGIAPCINDTSVATININPQPNAGADGNTTICDSSVAAINLFGLITGEQAGGVWTQTSGAGGVFNAAAGTYTPAAGATTSTFTYTLTGIAPCINDTSVATININPQPNAGADGNTTICDSSVAAINLFGLITGEQAGGVWTQTSGAGGVFNAAAGTYTPAAGSTTSTFTYTLTGIAPCINDTSVATININPQPNAGTDGNTTVCDSSVAAINLFGLITGEQAGGVWTQTSGSGGTFNAAAGTYTPAAGATTSTFTYTLIGTAPCTNDASIATVIINPTLTPTINCGVSTTSTVQFTWTAVAGATGYNVSYQVNLNPTVNVGAIGNVLTYSVVGLSPADSVLITLTPTGGVGTCFALSTQTCVALNCTPPTASISYGTPFCISNGVPQAVTLTGTGAYLGGTYSAPGLVINAVTGAITPSANAAGSYTVTYTIAAAAGCPQVTATAPITINPQPDAGTDGNTTICDSSVAVIDLFGLITGEQAGGVWTQTSGAGGVFNAGTGMFVPAVGATTSTFTYTLTGTAPCINDASVATVNINPQPNAGADGNTTICDSSVAAINLFGLITGEQAGGVWTQTSGAGGVFNAAAGTYTPAAGATTSTFTYTLTGIAPCINDTSVATININPQPNAGADGNTTICDSSVAAINLFGLITGEQAGGVWTQTSGAGGVFNAAAGTYTPAAGATTSTFTYTLTGIAPCINDTSVATININPQPNAGADGNTTICDSSVAAINLFGLITGEQAGGVWTQTSGAGGVFNAAAGTYTPAAGATTSTFTYTLTGVAPCINDTSVATININPQPNAGADGNTTICDSSVAAINLFGLITGEQAGGVWTQTSGAGGVFNAAAGTYTPAAGATTSTFTYTLTGIAPCINDTSVATININPQPNAGADGNTTVCDSSVAAINLFGLITGEQAGGVWTQTSGAGGVFNAAAGTYTPAAGATTSTFTYTLTGTAPCINDTSVATININPQPNAGADGNTTVCDSSVAAINLFGLITGEQAGGVWTQTSGAGGVFNAAAGTYTPAAGATTSTFTYTLTGIAPCINDTSVATININPQPNAGADGNTTICDSSVSAINLFGLITGEQAGGVWTQTSGAGGVFNAAAGTYTPAAGATTSTFTYTLTGIAPCINDTSVATININPQPNAGADGNTTICDSSVAAIDLFGLITGEQAGGVWTQTSGAGGVFNAAAGTYTPAAGATTSTFTYTLTGIAPCINDTSVATINVNPQPNAGADGNTTICDSSVAAIDLFGLITGEQAGGVWTQTSGAGGVFNAAAGTYTPAAGATTSTFTYTLTGIAPCINDTSVATININPQPNAGADGNVTVCDMSVAVIDLYSLITGEQAGGVWTQTSGSGGVFNAGAGTFTLAAGATTSIFTYTLTGIAPCINDTSVATVNVTPQPTAGVSGNTTVCDSNSTAIDLFSLITGEQAGGVWTQTSGAGGVFNAAVGTYTPAAGATTSTFDYSFTLPAPCVNVSSTATININPQPNAGADGNTTICDSSVAAINLFGLITGEQAGGVWTQTSGAGGVFNAAAGTYTPAAGATTSAFTYTLTGIAPCINDTSVATININPQPNAGADGNTTVCDSSVAAIDLFGLITGEQAGGVWTQTSGAGGLFNAAAGTYTPAMGATTSTFTYTLTGIAPCINDASVATININPQPNAGADGNTTICDSSITAINLFGLITGEQAGGVWTQTSGTGGVFNAAGGTYTPAAGATSSTFAYTLTGVAPCANDVSVATITINRQPYAGTDVSLVVCPQTASAINVGNLLTGEDAGGVWTQTSGPVGNFNPMSAIFTPPSGAAASVSTFTYTVTGIAPCINDASVVTITVNDQPDAGTNGNTTICDSSVLPVDLYGLITGEDLGGTWAQTSGSGGTFNGGTGTYTPAVGATTSTFAYTIVGTGSCVDVTSIATININPQPNAGADGNTTVCDSSVTAINLFGLITGEQAGGVWTQTSGSGGTFNAAAGTYTPAMSATTSTFTYTLTGTAPCINDTSVATININPQPNAGADGNTTVCDSSVAATNLFGLITGEQAGGVWTQTSGAGGVFNAAAGTYTPTMGATTSTFTYTLTGTAPCINDTSVATININPQPNAGADGNTTVCDSSVAAINLFGLITGEQAGGVWTQTSGAGGAFNAAAGTYTPAAGATTSTFTYTLTGTAPCINDTSVTTININPQPNAGADGNTTVCDSSVAAIDLFGLITGEQAGGVWTQTSGAGGVFNAAAGTYTPAAGATTSTFTYTLTGIAPCINDTSVATININPQPNAGTDGNTTVCDSSVAAIDLFGLITGEQAGGVWTQTSGAGGVFNAAAGTYTPAAGATTSTFTYTLTGTAPCSNDTSVATININPQPDAGADGNTIICDSSVAAIDLFGLITGEQAGGVWTQTSGAGGVFNAAAGTYTPTVGATTSTFAYTLTGIAPCINDSSIATINIKASPIATATPASEILCSTQYTGILLSSTIPGTTFSWTVSQVGVNGAGAGTGNNISQMLTATGTGIGTVVYTVTPTFNGCSGVPITVTVTVTPAAVATATPTAQVVCSGSATAISLSSTIPGTTFNWNAVQTNTTGASNGTGSTIVQTLTVLGNSPGEVVYAITPIVNGCPGATIFVPVTVNPIPVVTANPTSDEICSGATTDITLTSNVVGTTFSWAAISSGVFGASPGSGSVINQTLTTVGSVPGTVNYIITPTANGCAGAPITVTITVNPTPEVFGTGVTTICSGESPVITLSPSISGTTFTWTATQSGVSGASDGTAIASPFVIDQVLQTTGTTAGTVVYTITPSANGCAGESIDIVITVNPLPEPAIEDGVICVDQTTGNTFQTYLLDTGLSNANHSFVWSLYSELNPPISGATESTYEATGPGTYYVQATNTATGCVSMIVSATVIESYPLLSFEPLVSSMFSDNPTITVQGGNSLSLYQLDNGPLQSSNVFAPVTPGLHTITVTDINGCTNLTREVLVIGYPNYFTPNGDGIHDNWNIVGLSDQPGAEIHIFDRYGKLIKQISPTGQGWDGTFNGELLPSTDYWFTVDYFESGAYKTFKSHFSLKR